jgi:cell division GTPase FtsZ
MIGVGAAGNKSVINLVEQGVIPKEDIILINSTDMDVPNAYKSITHIITPIDEDKDDDEGFGKERARGKAAVIPYIQSGKLGLKEKAATGIYKFVCVVASTEGGTGSGAAPIIARYINSVIKLPTHIIGFIGFCNEGRGLQNTIEFMQDLEDGLIVHLIRNDKFLQEAGRSTLKAEEAANNELANTMRLITGQLIRESKQNMDKGDLRKSVNFPGYEICEYYELEDKIRNRKDYDAILTQICDNSHAMQSSNGMKRLGLIMNISESEQLYADDFSVLINRYGVPYEKFAHYQHEPGKEFIAIICSGLKMPIEEVEELKNAYSEISNSVDKTEDDFFAKVSEMKGNPEDSQFNSKKVEVNSGDEDAFFASLIRKDSNPSNTAVTEY